MKIEFGLFLFALLMLLTSGCQETAEQSAGGDELAESGIVASNGLDEDAAKPVDIVAAKLANLDSGDLTVGDVVAEKSASAGAWADLLAPGSKAPAIDLAAVVHGPQVRPFSGDHVVVVEFWATWCGPCIRNMPHLSRLQQQYGAEVQFIGITDEDEDTIMEFMAGEIKDGDTWSDILSYSICLDRNGRTGANFMEAAAQSLIPCAFVIDKQGRVAWIGHPAEIDGPLVRIVNGTWDIDTARKQFLAVARVPETPRVSVRATPTLELGMPAPVVQLASVVHGEPFNGEFTEGRTYVVEFWATWCGPCVSSMPHMAAVQQKYGDLVQIVGITAEDPESVTEFLGRDLNDLHSGRKWSDVLTYTIALDDEHTTNTNYMEAADQNGIPCVFIINQSGHVAWIGHPMEMDEPLAQVVSENYNIEQATALFRAERKLRTAIENRDFDSALELLSELSRSQSDKLRFQRMELDLLSQLGRRGEFNETAAIIVDSNVDQFELLNGIAWKIAAMQKGDGRDLDLALKAGMLASEGTDHSNCSILDTVARVYYEQGDIPQAVLWQKKAVSVAEGSQISWQLLNSLRDYQSKLPESGVESSNAVQDGLTVPDK